MAEKVSRKELRQPDDFVSFTHRVLSWLSVNRFMLIAGTGLVVAIVLGFFAWRWYVESQTQKASRSFIEAREILDARVIPREDAEGTSQVDGTYASEQDKLRAALAAFEGVRQNFANSATASLATFFIAECLARLGEYDRAQAEFQAYLRAEGNSGELSPYAIEGMAAALEDAGKLEQAAQHYQRLTEPPFEAHRDRGLFHLARLDEKQERLAEAVRRFKQLLEEFPDTAYARDIQQRLALLPELESPAPEKAALPPEAGGAGEAPPGEPESAGAGKSS